jgi:hypothetical protein
MKKWFVIISPVLLVFGSVWLAGCSSHKLTEPEARMRAEAEYEHICRVIINYETNEFIGPKMTIGKGEQPNELCYGYVWAHKSLNLEIGVVVTESGDVAGGPSPKDYKTPVAPMPKRIKTAQ